MGIETSRREAGQELDIVVGRGLDDFEARITGAVLAIEREPSIYSVEHSPPGFSLRPEPSVLDSLKNGRVDERLLSRYFALINQAWAVRESFTGSRMDAGAIVEIIHHDFDGELLRKVLVSEGLDGSFHKMLYEGIQEVSESPNQSFKPHARLLQQIYGLSHPLELLKQSSDSVLACMRAALLSEKGMRQLYDHAQYPDGLSSAEWVECDKEQRRVWMREVVQTATDMEDVEMADSYVYAASRSDTRDHVRIVDVIQKIELLGKEKLASIRGFNGIYALADYSLDQLEAMALIAEGYPDELDRLREHDVTVMFTNKMGDGNNILSKNPAMVDDKSRRVIFFEIQSLRDIYQSIHRLHERGIKPSTLILAAHLFRGQVPVARKPPVDSTRERLAVASVHTSALVEHANATSDGSDFGYTMYGMKGLGRLVDDFMQPSRGIDDPAESAGRKRAVFLSCESAAELQVRDFNNETGKVESLGYEASVIGRIADDMVESGVRSEIELFGAGAAIQIKETPRGFGYTVRVDGHGRAAEAGIKLAVAYGEVARSHVEEIQLRNFDKEPGKENPLVHPYALG